MKGDFTRSTFAPGKHYSGVRMQQGRVQLDADWNENLDILLHRIETETLDVIGECGVPVHHPAFGVVTDFSTLSAEEQAWLTEAGLDTLTAGDFFLTGGRAYVDGILVEVDQTLPFSQQPFVLPKGGGKITSAGIYLLYLDVWTRLLTALEDPSIREVALGGPDTATRMQTVWQARLAAVGEAGDTVTCADDLHPWPEASTGTLRARTHPEDLPSDPCTVPPGAGYKRLENQLYRVEIHKGSGAAGGPTFKWSRDNGSIAVAISDFAVDGVNTKIRTTSLGRDDVLGLHENDWVEISDDASDLAGNPGTLVKITKIDPDNILTLSGPVSGYAPDGHPKVRRWDSAGELTVEVAPDNDGYLKLEGGVEIKFDTAGTFRTGDYWLIPARTVPGQYGDIEWPEDGSDPAALLPFGIVHHYCKLAVITVSGGAAGGLVFTDVEDCRKPFPPLTELPQGGDCCCSVSVGQGGEYADLQSAIDARPEGAKFWRICLPAGEYRLSNTVVAEAVKGLIISGCGRQTHIYGPQGEPAFYFAEAEDLQLENLWIDASSAEPAIIVKVSWGVVINGLYATNQVQEDQILSEGYELNYNDVLYRANKDRFGQPGPLIQVQDCQEVTIRDNDLFGLPAIQANGKDLSILRNRISGGGIQIVPPGLSISIEENTIFKGIGPGVQLGGGENTVAAFDEYVENRPGMNALNPFAGLRLVTITRNLIGRMTGSGIITETSLLEIGKLADVEFLTIRDNQIVSCANKPDLLLGEKFYVGGGLNLMGVFNTRIEDNFIADSGMGKVPACGIFVLDGSDITIDGNTVVENGVGVGDDEPSFYQAGIAALYVFGNGLGLENMEAGKIGYPALRLQDNRVVCPAGQALTVTALGGVSVHGNTFATRERLKQPVLPFVDFGEKGACVYIYDLGLPVWMQDFATLLMAMASGNTSLHVEDVQLLGEKLEIYPDGRVQFNDNQVTFQTQQEEQVKDLGKYDSQWFLRAWQAATFSVLLASLDDISLNDNQLQANVPAYVWIAYEKLSKNEIGVDEFLAYMLKFIHASAVATTLRSSDNALVERLMSNAISYASNATAMNITTGNEATHDIITAAPKKVEVNNLSLTS